MESRTNIPYDQLISFPWEGKAILLMDLDAFFASVEQLDHPEWRGKPVIVGSPSSVRGVVSTCSYEARKYGVRSAMASSVAERLCPDAIWVMPNHTRYKEVSNVVMGFLHDETPFVQQVSIDEAFADVTPGRYSNESPITVAKRIQQRVADLGVSCSIGISTSKTVSKIASEQGKPRGLTVVLPGNEKHFLEPLPVGEMSGVGASSKAALQRFGIKTLGDLSRADDSVLRSVFGKNAELFRLRSQGLETSEVNADREVKSVSHEVSFPIDLTNRSDLEDTLFGLSERVGQRLRKHHRKGKTVVVKVRYSDRRLRSAQAHLDQATDNELVFYPHALELLNSLWTDGIPIRLLGVGISSFVEDGEGDQEFPQLSLFQEEQLVKPIALGTTSKQKLEQLIEASDSIKNKFGNSSLLFGRTQKHNKKK